MTTWVNHIWDEYCVGVVIDDKLLICIANLVMP